jgi:hypothetical protein
LVCTEFSNQSLPNCNAGTICRPTNGPLAYAGFSNQPVPTCVTGTICQRNNGPLAYAEFSNQSVPNYSNRRLPDASVVADEFSR